MGIIKELYVRSEGALRALMSFGCFEGALRVLRRRLWVFRGRFTGVIKSFADAMEAL